MSVSGSGETDKEQQERTLRLAFNNIKTALEQWGAEVDNKIKEALDASPTFDYGLAVKIPPAYRVKAIDSFIKKALYRKPYADPLAQVEDKVGTRVVVLTSQHMKQVRDILLAKCDFWNCTIGRDKALIKESIKEFDYEAVHLIVKPLNTSDSRNKENLPYLSCEIQIKTLFQHAYSEISHDTVYKGPYRHDLVLLRKLARSMALLESTDENFNSMYSYINSGEGLALNFLTELTDQFKKINPVYDEKKADRELDSYILDELMQHDILTRLDMEDISSFVEQKKQSLKRINDKQNFLIGKHPVMILLGYIIFACPDYLYSHKLDLDIDALRSLAYHLGASYEPTC